jgi:hypothetical protein
MPKQQGNDPPEGSQGDGDEPKFMTAEEFNAAFTKRAKDLETKFSKMLNDTVGSVGTKLTEFTSSIDEKLSALKPVDANTQQQQQQGPKLEDSPLVKGMQKKITELEESTRIANERATAEERKVRDADLRQRALAALEANGFTDAGRARKALTLLIAEGRIHYGEDGTDIVFRGDDNDEVDLATGVKTYAKSDDAKIFLPPKGAQGAGSRPGGTGTKPGEKANANAILSDFFNDQ